MSEKTIIYSILFAYFSFILYIGLRHARDVKNSEDYLVGGRKFGWFLIFASTSATLIGGGATMGAISRTYEWGILMAAVSTGWYLQLIFSGIFIAPAFRRLRVYTVAGYLRETFDERVRWLASVISLLFAFGCLAAQMVAFGKVVVPLLPPVPFLDDKAIYLIALGIGAVTIIGYNFAGGLYHVVWTDLYQFLVLFIGFIITAALCFSRVEIWDTSHVPEHFFRITGDKSLMYVVGMFIAIVMGEMFAPTYVTRFCAGKDRRHVLWGITGSGLLLLLTMPVIIFTIAVSARVVFTQELDPQMALPKIIKEMHNPWVSGLVLSALICAMMSSGDSILNSGTNIVVKDFIEPLGLHKRIWSKSSSMLWVSRCVCLVLGGIALLIAYLLPNILDLLLISYSVWAPAVVVPCIVATFKKLHISSSRMLLVMSSGIFCALVGRFFGSVFDPGASGMIGSVAVYSGLLVYSRIMEMKAT
ncbi:MAG: sodium:solute symporter family protein [Verrucomicrobia bacterium]|nr:sodium:solute symporter family protein [Verrucomicrobiota bacterium]